MSVPRNHQSLVLSCTSVALQGKLYIEACNIIVETGENAGDFQQKKQQLLFLIGEKKKKKKPTMGIRKSNANVTCTQNLCDGIGLCPV